MNDPISASPRARAARRFSFDHAAIWVLTITVALAAIAFIPVSTVSFVYTKISILAIGGLVALALYILARLTRGNVIVPPIALLGSIWLVPLAYGLSTLFSSAGSKAAFFGTQFETDTFGFMLLLALFATVAALVFRRTNQYRVFFNVGAVVVAVTLVAQVIFLILGHAMPNQISATANLIGSFTDFGMFIGLGTALTLLAIRFVPMKGWVKIAVWVGLALELFGLAISNIALVWVLTALVALGLFIEAILRRRSSVDESDLEGVETLTSTVEISEEESKGENISLVAPLIALVIALFFLIGGSTIGNSLTSAAGTTMLDVRPSWQSTFNVGSHTYASSPIFGSGPNTFGSQWLKFRDRSLNSTVFWNVDFVSGIGIIPTSIVTTGLLGALAWIAFIALFIIIGLRALLFRTPSDPYARFASIATFTGALYVFALATFAVPGPMVLVTGWFLIGLFVSSLRYAGARQEWGIIFARNPRVGFVIVFCFTLLLLGSVGAAYVVTEHYLADYSYNKAAVALNNGDLAGSAAALNQSILFNPTDRAYQLAADLGLAQMNKIATNSSLTPAQAQQQFQSALSTSVQAALTATKLGPNNYQNWEVLGQVYASVVPLNIDGAYQSARTAYQHAEQLNPTNPTIPFVLAQLDITGKDAASAEADLNQAISLKSDYTQAIFLLAQLEAEEGKAKDALQAAEAAAYFSPNDPTIQFEVGILRSANGDTAGAINALSQAVALNPQYANARFFLAVMYTMQNSYPQALAQLQAVAALSKDNSAAVANDIAQLQAGKNPFPPSQLGALGVTAPSVSDTSAKNTPPTNTTTSTATH